MTIKPIDILYMLDNDMVLMMDYNDLAKLCNMITLDYQLEKEENARKSFSDRRNLC